MNERIESMTEILETIGISANEDQIKQLVEDFSLHIEMEAEMESYKFAGYTEKCNNCDTLKREISGLKYELESYQNGVKKRHPMASHVYIENGEVKYDL